MPNSDEELLAEARAGDRLALERLLERHQRRVFRFGMKMCGEEEDAKDILQETLIAAARGIRDFRGASSVSTWLYTIARSFCIKQRRRPRGAPAVIESLDLGEPGRAARELPDQARTPEQALEGRRVAKVLEDAIGALGPVLREVLLLRDVEGLSTAEAAEALVISVEAVKSRLHRARLEVRARVAPALLGTIPVAQPRSDYREVVGRSPAARRERTTPGRSAEHEGSVSAPAPSVGAGGTA